jgi:hypothetical protein
VDRLLRRLRSPAVGPRESVLLDVVTSALKECGSSVVEHGPQDGGFDIAVWADELGASVGNPLLIELKAQLSLEGGGMVRDRLMHLASGQIRWVLLLYDQAGSEGIQNQFGDLPGVLVLSIQEFLNGLRHSSLGDLVRGLRNRTLHGWLG